MESEDTEALKNITNLKTAHIIGQSVILTYAHKQVVRH